MNHSAIVQLSAFPGWIVGVSRNTMNGYYCWVIDPNFAVLCDGCSYKTSSAAMTAGRLFVERNL